jgi:hypothetical protein
MLEDITTQLINEVLEHEHHQNEVEDDIYLNTDHDHGEHEEHIEVTAIRDITIDVKVNNHEIIKKEEPVKKDERFMLLSQL